jgi:hypothetical protein
LTEFCHSDKAIEILSSVILTIHSHFLIFVISILMSEVQGRRGDWEKIAFSPSALHLYQPEIYLMRNKNLRFSLFVLLIAVSECFAQNNEKVFFDNKDSTSNYYLAVKPISGNIKGALILFSSFNNVENILAETKLHNIAYGNDLLTVFASLDTKLCADKESIDRISAILRHVRNKFAVDSGKFALGGFDFAGNIILRYAELAFEHPAQFPAQPKAVFAIACPVDLIALMKRSENQIKKNFFPGAVGDAKYILNALTTENGPLDKNLQKYIGLSPFYAGLDTTGNERYLKNVPLRLYYDTDIGWELKNRRNSVDDTNIPDGSEMIKRLLLLGNNDAEFVTAKLPPTRSTGLRNTNSWSIVDEVDCVQWIKRKLDIFDPYSYVPDYFLPMPDKWGVERFQFPIEFATAIPYKGIEDVRFAPGWGDKNSAEYWSYCFLWWLDGDPQINLNDLEEDLKMYYTGLVGRNIPIRKIPPEKLVPVHVALKKVKQAPNDLETYSGTVNMLDYFLQKPMILNAVVHVRNCPEKNRKVLFFEISPKPETDLVWISMNSIFSEFRCFK